MLGEIGKMKLRNRYNGIVLGPLLKEDAQFLQAIIRMCNPKTVVEFGFFWGDSARAMLEAMDQDAVLHSFDNTKDGGLTDPRFRFHKISQELIHGINDIDFVFLDASHDFELNTKTFNRLLELVSDSCIIAIHDTGRWMGGNVFNALDGKPAKDGSWIHCPGEIDFVNWIKDTHPEWQQIHFHSNRQVRHGITLLQRYKRLENE